MPAKVQQNLGVAGAEHPVGSIAVSMSPATGDAGPLRPDCDQGTHDLIVLYKLVVTMSPGEHLQ